jgi:hypothetical protein
MHEKQDALLPLHTAPAMLTAPAAAARRGLPKNLLGVREKTYGGVDAAVCASHYAAQAVRSPCMGEEALLPSARAVTFERPLYTGFCTMS